MVAEYDAAGTLLTEYVWMDDRPIAVIANAGSGSPVTYWVHTDHLERPVLMTDGSAAVVWQASYLPYGEVVSITGTATLDQRFPGQWFQLESGLAYNWHRHYDATTGRYLQPDPLGMPDGPSRYAYVENSPLMYVDPEGRWLTLAWRGIQLLLRLGPIIMTMPEPVPIPVPGPQPISPDDLVDEPLFCPLPGTGLPTGPLILHDDDAGAEHTKGARPSTKGKHEAGRARKLRDRGDEKADKSRRAKRKKPDKKMKGPWPPRN